MGWRRIWGGGLIMLSKEGGGERERETERSDGVTTIKFLLF